MERKKYKVIRENEKVYLAKYFYITIIRYSTLTSNIWEKLLEIFHKKIGFEKQTHTFLANLLSKFEQKSTKDFWKEVRKRKVTQLSVGVLMALPSYKTL